MEPPFYSQNPLLSPFVKTTFIKAFSYNNKEFFMKKNRASLAGILALALVLGMTIVGCDNGTTSRGKSTTTTTGGGGGGDTYTFNNIAEFKAVLNSAPNYTSYDVVLNVSDLGGDVNAPGSIGNALRTNQDKYVNLDLSGSTITSIGNQAFHSCRSLTGVTIPNIRKTARFT
jgi:hypothetical protein